MARGARVGAHPQQAAIAAGRVGQAVPRSCLACSWRAAVASRSRPPKGAPTLVPTALPTAAPRPCRPADLCPRRHGAGPTSADAPPTGAAQAGADREADGTAARDLIVLQGADVTTLDPHLSTFSTDINATFTLFDNLTFRNEDQSVIRPMLATEWKVQDRRWEMKLRPNVRFHNGDPLTADDVKFSIERTYDPARRRAWRRSSRPSSGSRRQTR